MVERIQQAAGGEGAGMGPAANARAPASASTPQDLKLRGLCKQVESIFWQQLLTRMRATIPDDGLAIGKAEKFMQGTFDEALAGQMSQRGNLGLGDAIYRQLAPFVAGPAGAEGSAAGPAHARALAAFRAAAPAGGSTSRPNAPSTPSAPPAAGPAPATPPQAPARAPGGG